MKFSIYKCQNGFLLNVTAKGATKSYVFKPTERMQMLAKIDDVLGEEPPDSSGMEHEQKS